MKIMLCIRDKFGDTHATERHGRAHTRAFEFAEMLGLDEGEPFEYGVTFCDDEGAARLREWRDGDVLKYIMPLGMLTVPVMSVSLETETSQG